MRRYRLLDYMSDALVEAYGLTLEDAFANAALATTSVIVDLRTLSPSRISESVVVRGFDEKSLLYNWLEAVLIKKDAERKMFRSFHVKIHHERSGWRLDGMLSGDLMDTKRQRFKRDVKAVTYHEMEIKKGAKGYVIRFLLDL